MKYPRRRNRLRFSRFLNNAPAEILEERTLLSGANGPDLAAISFDALDDHARDAVTDIDVILQNKGNEASIASQAHVVWSTDEIHGNDDDVIVPQSTFNVPPLPAGATFQKTLTLHLDRSLLYQHAVKMAPPGEDVGTSSGEVSYLFLSVDPSNSVIETDEANNQGQRLARDGDDITYFPWDRDSNGSVTPREALQSIFAINTADAATDLDGNGITTPLESLGFLQRIGYHRNDAPYAIHSSFEVAADNFTPERSIDLSDIFSTIQDSALTYRVASFDNAAMTAEIVGGELRLAGIDGFSGKRSVVLEAEDSSSRISAFTVEVDLHRPLEPLAATQIQDVAVDEDAADSVIDLNEFFTVQRPGFTLSFDVTSADDSIVEASLDSSSLRLVYAEDKFGSVPITVTPQLENHGGVINKDAITFIAEVAPVNDSPFVENPIDPITLNNSNTSETIDLSAVFADVDDSSLTYRVTSAASPHVNVAIAGTILTLTSVDDQVGSSEVKVEASDSAGRTAVLSIPVVTDFSVLEVSFFQPSGQLVASGGSTVVSIPVEGLDPSQLTLVSSNLGLIDNAQLNLVAAGQGVELTIRCSGSDYGASYITVGYKGQVVAAMVAIVLPSAEPTDTGEDLEFQISLTRGQSNSGIAVHEFRRSVNDRTVVARLARGEIDTATAFEILEPDFRSYTREILPELLPSVSQVGGRYVLVQPLRDGQNSRDEHFIDDQLDDIWIGFGDLTDVQAQIDVRNPRADLESYFVGPRAEALFENASTAIAILDAQSRPEELADLIQQTNKVQQVYARTLQTLNHGGDAQAVMQAAEFFARSSILLGAMWESAAEPIDATASESSGPEAAVQSARSSGRAESLGFASADVQGYAGQELTFNTQFLSDTGTQTVIFEAPKNGPFRLRVIKEVTEVLKASASKSDATAEIIARLKDATRVIGEVGGAVLETAGNLAPHADSILRIGSLVGDIIGLIFNEENYRDTYILDGNVNRTVSSGNRPDTVKTGGGNDDIRTHGGADNVDAGGGDNVVFTGKGDDVLRDGDGDSFLSSGAGDDTIYPDGGSDVVQPGDGDDEIIFEDNDFGQDIIIDTSQKGTIKFLLATRSQIELSKDGTDLKIGIAGTDAAVKLADFFSNEMTQWVVCAIDGLIDLFQAARGLSLNEALELSVRSYDEIDGLTSPDNYESSLPTSVASHHQKTFKAEFLGLSAELYFINGDSRNLAIAIRGSNNPTSVDGLLDWVVNNPLAGLPQAIWLGIGELHGGDYFKDVQSVTVTGHSLGGMVAQWVGAYAAAVTSAKFVNIYTFNSPDVSGFVKDVLPLDVLNIFTGMTNINTVHSIQEDDLVSQIGVFSGNGLGSTSFRTFEWGSQALDEWSLKKIQRDHGPPSRTERSDLDPFFDSVRFKHISKEKYANRQLLSWSDFKKIVFSFIDDDGKQRTSNAYQLLGGDRLLQRDLDEQTAREDEYRSETVPDDAVAEAFFRQFDFGPRESLVQQHYIGVSEIDVYDPDEDGIRFGWESTANLRSQDRGRADDLRRDFISTPDNTFIVDTDTPGTFNILFTIGDRRMGQDAIIREDMRLYVNGFYLDTVSTMPGQILDLGYQFETDEPQLRISLQDQSGRSSRAVLNALTIELVAPGTEAPESTVVQNDDSLIVITHGYTLPEGIGTVIDTIEVTAEYITHIAEQSVQVVIAAGKAAVKGFIAGGPAGAKAAAIKAAIFKTVELKLQDVKSILMRDFTSVRAKSPVHDWVFDTADQLAFMAQEFRLGSLDTNIIPVDFSDAYATVTAPNATNKQKLRHWEGSQDFLVLDWTRESNNGLGLQEMLSGNPAEDVYRQSVNGAARVYKELIEARIAEHKKANPEADLDLLLISHGFGYNVNRELVERLSRSEFADDLDYVKFQSLDPISMNPDELLGTTRESDKYYWYHPEFNPIVDQVENIYQTEGFFKVQGLLDPDSIANKVINVLGGVAPGPLNGAIRGSMLLVGKLMANNSAKINEALTYGRPLDGRVGGGNAGFYNGQARVFDLSTSEELLRFRHWDTDAVNLQKGRLATELTDQAYSPDGLLLATAGEDGIVTVRYTQDVPDPDPAVTTPMHRTGDVAFTVWGQDSVVRSLEFTQIEVLPGVWKDYLLTLSSPRGEDIGDPDYTSTDRNKVVLTDVEEKRTIWQGRDIGGTQVAASPSGNLMVTTDRNGNAKVWLRNQELVTTFDSLQPIAAHPAGDGSRILDLVVVNDEYFITASADKSVRVWHVDDGEVRRKGLPYEFGGKARNLAYDPYNGILAVAAGSDLWFYTFDQGTGALLLEAHRPDDHVAAIQGLAFTVPDFMIRPDGNFAGLRSLPAEVFRNAGDIDRDALKSHVESIDSEANTLDGLRLVSGGEDRTLFMWNLSQTNWAIKNFTKDSVLSGAMLPIREVAVTYDGNQVSVVGQNNIQDSDGNYVGGPVRDINATNTIDERIGFSWTELFIGGVREHADVPYYYTEEIVLVSGEEWFWQRDNDALSRPGDLPKDRNLAIPPNKRDALPGIDQVPVNAQVRPGKDVKIRPLKYLLEIDRDNYDLTHIMGVPIDQFTTMDLEDANEQIVGTLRVSGKDDTVLVFTGSTELDFAETSKFITDVTVSVAGSEDENGVEITTDVTATVTVINHAPVINDDVLSVYPDRTRDFRPMNNDYDVEGDTFKFFEFQDRGLAFKGEIIGHVRKVDGEPGLLRVVTTITPERFEQLIVAEKAADPDAPDYVEVPFDYDVRETKYNTLGSGTVFVRLQSQEAPTNLRDEEVGADQFRLHWEPVGWSASKYVIERFDSAIDDWVKHTETSSGNAESKLVKGLQPNHDYLFRVVAKNSNRETVSESIPVSTPDYEGPQSVVPLLPTGATFIDVRWEKVFWDAKSYIVKLQNLVVDGDGQPLLGANNELQFADFKQKIVDHDERAYHRFKNLDPGTTYLLSVTAQRPSDDTTAPPTFADQPTTTALRLVPSGVVVDRTGPAKIKVTWVPVTWNGLQKYRVVAVNAETLERVSAKQTEPGDTSAILDENLQPFNEDSSQGTEPSRIRYIVFVEAKDGKGNWVSAFPEGNDGVTLLTSESPNVSLDSGENDFVIDRELDGEIGLPTVADQDFGTFLTLGNQSRHPVTLKPFPGEQIYDVHGNELVDSITLSPAVIDGAETNVLTYSLTRRDRNGWELLRTSDAKVTQLPSYAENPFEPDSLVITEGYSSVRVEWHAPLWRVKNYHLELTADASSVATKSIASKLNADGQARMDATYSYEFTDLTPNKEYTLAFTAKGNSSAKRGEHQQTVNTIQQFPPRGINDSEVSFTSFRAGWDDPGWEAKQFRVKYFQVDQNGNEIPDTERAILVQGNKTSKLITGLVSGATYQFTVDGQSKADDAWLTNDLDTLGDNTIRVQLLSVDRAHAVAQVDPDSIGRRSFTLTWTHPDRTNVDSFKIRISPDNGTTWLKVRNSNNLAGGGLSSTRQTFEVTQVQKSAGSSMFEPLTNGATYLVQLFAVYQSPDIEIALPVPLTVITKLRYAPENVVATTAGPTSATIVWEHDGDGVNEYRIWKRRTDNSWVLHKSGIAADQQSVTINNGPTKLIPGETYAFEVVAVYNASNERSASSNEITLHAATAPLNVDVPDEHRQRRQLRVTWDPPHPAWDVDKYRVELYRANDRTNPWKQGVVGKNATHYDFSQLDVDTEYYAQVSAENLDLASLSVPSDQVQTRTRNRVAPDPISVTVLGPTKVHVTWEHDGEGINEFRILKRNQSGDWVIAKSNISASIREFTLTNQHTKLIPEVEYSFRVVADYNAENLQSEVKTVTLPQATKPTNLRVTNRLHRQLTIAWDAPSPLWDINNYRAEVYRVGQSTPVDTVNANLSTSATFTGLDVDTSYEVRVVARNPDLDGLEVASDRLATRTMPYLAPTGPTFSDVQTRQMTVNWTHSDPGGLPSRYRVFRNGISIGTVNSNQCAGGACAYIDTALSPGQTYSYYIQAEYPLQNLAGPSASRQTIPVAHVAPTITSISNIRKAKFDVTWSFSGDRGEVEKFTVRRNNTAKTKLATLNPVNFPGQTTFTKEDVARNNNANWWIIVRVHYFDGTVRDSVAVQIS